MSDYTVLRVSVGTDAVAKALDALPGISVVDPDDSPESGRVDVLPERDTDASETPSVATEPPFEPAEDTTPAWREYGLLGVGASLVVLGIATAGIWWYRRRSGNETEVLDPADGETPAPVDPTAVERPTAGSETPSPGDSTGRAESATGDDDSDGRTVLGDEIPATDTEPPGRTEDRDDVEWTTRTENISTEDRERQPSADRDESEPESPTETDADPRDQVDVAPLLGVAFLAVSGAVVRWVQRVGDAE